MSGQNSFTLTTEGTNLLASAAQNSIIFSSIGFYTYYESDVSSINNSWITNHTNALSFSAIISSSSGVSIVDNVIGITGQVTNILLQSETTIHTLVLMANDGNSTDIPFAACMSASSSDSLFKFAAGTEIKFTYQLSLDASAVTNISAINNQLESYARATTSSYGTVKITGSAQDIETTDSIVPLTQHIREYVTSNAAGLHSATYNTWSSYSGYYYITQFTESTLPDINYRYPMHITITKSNNTIFDHVVCRFARTTSNIYAFTYNSQDYQLMLRKSATNWRHVFYLSIPSGESITDYTITIEYDTTQYDRIITKSKPILIGTAWTASFNPSSSTVPSWLVQGVLDFAEKSISGNYHVFAFNKDVTDGAYPQNVFAQVIYRAEDTYATNSEVQPVLTVPLIKLDSSDAKVALYIPKNAPNNTRNNNVTYFVQLYYAG